MTAVPMEQTGRYACPVCPKRFHVLSEKKQHVRVDHKKAKA